MRDLKLDSNWACIDDVSNNKIASASQTALLLNCRCQPHLIAILGSSGLVGKFPQAVQKDVIIRKMTNNGPAFGVADFKTWSDYANLDRQLSNYFKKSASGIILPMLFSFLPLTSCSGTPAAIAFSVFAVLSLVSNVVPLLFVGTMQQHRPSSAGAVPHGQQLKPPPALLVQVDDANKRRVERLCFAAYASNLFLMSTAVCLAAVISKIYAVLAAPLLLIFLVIFVMFIDCGLRHEFVWGALQYKHHHSDLKFFFDLSSEVTQTAFTGLTGSLLGSLKSCQQSSSYSRPAEGIILYAVIVGLFLMLVCTVPPALMFLSAREKMVRLFLRSTAYVVLGLLSLAGFLAAAAVLEVYAVFATTVVIAVGAFWFYKVYRSGPDMDAPRPDEHERHVAGERSLMWLGVHSVMFTALMASYSASLRGQQLSGLYRTCVFFVFAVLLTNFARMVLVREVQDKGNEASVVRVSGLAIIVLMVLAVMLLILLVMLQPEQLRNTLALV